MSSAIVERHETIRGLLRALRTKRFLILAGLSGTGKTQLARRIAHSAVAIDQQQGVGTGLNLIEQSLDGAVSGKDSFLFESVAGHPDYVRVKSVGSGSVKAKAAPLHKRRVGFLPVRPDWTDAKKVWGYYNPLTGRFYPTDALAVLLNAYRNYLEFGDEAGNYFLILDEMNLARVEYYFSDMLSLMESGCSEDPSVPGRFLTGETARVHPLNSLIVSAGQRGVHDERSAAEAQAAFSNVDTGGKRVMSVARTGTVEQMVPLRELDDRKWLYEALVKGLEFVDRPKEPLTEMDERRHALPLLYPIPPRVAYPPNLTVIGTINVDETTHAFAPKVLDRAFVLEFTNVCYDAAVGNHPLYGEVGPLLAELHAAMSPSGHHFGYRVAVEMLDYVGESGGRLDPAIGDFLLMSKVLPKLRGTEGELGTPLKKLKALADKHGFGQSAQKLATMLQKLSESGFTSFF